MTIERSDNNVQLGSRNNFSGPVHVHSTKSVSNITIAISLTLTISLTVGTFLIAKNYYQTSKPEPASLGSPTPPQPIVQPSAPLAPPLTPSVSPRLVTRNVARPKIVHDRRPRAGEQKGCYIPTQSSCELVVKAGSGGEEETYEFKSNTAGRKIKRASLSFSVVIEDEPSDQYKPNKTDYWLQVTINGNKLGRVFKLEGLARGFPKKQQFDPGSFRAFHEDLDWSEFDYIRPINNTIRYQIGGAPVGGWMLFSWSELRVEYE